MLPGNDPRAIDLGAMGDLRPAEMAKRGSPPETIEATRLVG
jgi:hypothetical protein